jgi:hypothetical protein
MQMLLSLDVPRNVVLLFTPLSAHPLSIAPGIELLTISDDAWSTYPPLPDRERIVPTL